MSIRHLLGHAAARPAFAHAETAQGGFAVSGAADRARLDLGAWLQFDDKALPARAVISAIQPEIDRRGALYRSKELHHHEGRAALTPDAAAALDLAIVGALLAEGDFNTAARRELDIDLAKRALTAYAKKDDDTPIEPATDAAAAALCARVAAHKAAAAAASGLDDYAVALVFGKRPHERERGLAVDLAWLALLDAAPFARAVWEAAWSAERSYRPLPEEKAAAVFDLADVRLTAQSRYDVGERGLRLLLASHYRDGAIYAERKALSEKITAEHGVLNAWEYALDTVYDFETGRYLNSGLKRAFDIVVAIGLLLALSPVFLVVLAVMAFEKGPTFFGHGRIGRGGKIFRCMKFRTMVVNAQEVLDELLARDPAAREEWEKTQKLKDDPRITKLGRILRKTSLDELPQLFNVLRGDMSIVGVRPISVGEAERWGRFHAAYKAARPGLTGPWQIYFRSTDSYSKRFHLMLHYYANATVGRDLYYLAMTFIVPLQTSKAG